MFVAVTRVLCVALWWLTCVVVDADAWLPAIDTLKLVSNTWQRVLNAAFYIFFDSLWAISHIHVVI
jgi:hypothetical protein